MAMVADIIIIVIVVIVVIAVIVFTAVIAVEAIIMIIHDVATAALIISLVIDIDRRRSRDPLWTIFVLHRSTARKSRAVVRGAVR